VAERADSVLHRRSVSLLLEIGEGGATAGPADQVVREALQRARGALGISSGTVLSPAVVMAGVAEWSGARPRRTRLAGSLLLRWLETRQVLDDPEQEWNELASSSLSERLARQMAERPEALCDLAMAAVVARIERAEAKAAKRLVKHG